MRRFVFLILVSLATVRTPAAEDWRSLSPATKWSTERCGSSDSSTSCFQVRTDARRL